MWSENLSSETCKDHIYFCFVHFFPLTSSIYNVALHHSSKNSRLDAGFRHLFPELLWTTNTHGCPHTHQPTYLHSNLPISTTNYTLTQQHINLPTCDQPTFLTWIQDQIYKHMSTHVTCQHACLHTYRKYTSLPTSTSAYTYSSLLHLHPLPPHPYLDLKGSWGH
jgi:hypothetical protein